MTLIAIEGLDQSGKETQARQLRARVEETGRTVHAISFPDYETPVGRELQRALAGEREFTPDVMQLLYVANRFEYKARLDRWLAAGDVVICDRYRASSIAYGEAQGLDAAWLNEVQRPLPAPLVTVLLDIAPETAVKRKSTGRDRYERDLSLLARVRESYRRQVAQPDWVFIDAEHGPTDLETCVEMVRAAECSGVVPIIRMPYPDPQLVNRYLDTGARGVLVPHMHEPKLAEAIVQAVRYRPLGHRGAGGNTRAARYGVMGHQRYVRHANDNLVFGILEDTEARGERQVYNSVVLVDAAGQQVYRKRHLVPFGEYFPVPERVREWMRMMSLPHSDISAGAAEQPLLETRAGVRLATMICYEDAYNAEQLYALPAAGLLVNVSNDAWFGDSIAAHQHLQIARRHGVPALRRCSSAYRIPRW